MDDMISYNRQLIDQFRANRGKSDDPFAARPMLLLTTTGAKSGEPRTSPMMGIPNDDRMLVIASNMGAAHHPAWYHNLAANPQVTVETRDATYQATATTAEGEERERLWSQIVADYPFFAQHQAKTEREIPVVILSPGAN